MSMKWPTQMLPSPSDTPPSSSHRARAQPRYARARLVQRNPRKAPRNDIAKPSEGVNGPYEKSVTRINMCIPPTLPINMNIMPLLSVGRDPLPGLSLDIYGQVGHRQAWSAVRGAMRVFARLSRLSVPAWCAAALLGHILEQNAEIGQSLRKFIMSV